MNICKEGDRLYTGAICSKSFADDYNRISADIEQKQAAGWNVEALLNGRHNMFQAFAMLPFYDK